MNMHKAVFPSFNDFSPFKYIHPPSHSFFLSSYGHYINSHTHTIPSAHKQLASYEQVPSGFLVLLCRSFSQVPTNRLKHRSSWAALTSSTWSSRTGGERGNSEGERSPIVDDTVGRSCPQFWKSWSRILHSCHAISVVLHLGKPPCRPDNALLITAGALRAKRKCY